MFPNLNDLIERQKCRRNAALKKMKVQSGLAVERMKEHFQTPKSLEEFAEKHPVATVSVAALAGVLVSKLLAPTAPTAGEQRVVVDVRHSGGETHVSPAPEPSFMDKVTRGAAVAMSIHQMIEPLLNPQPAVEQDQVPAHVPNGT